MITHLSLLSSRKITIPVTVRNTESHYAIDIEDALWDTGSSQTILSKDIAEAIGLRLGKRGEADTPGNPIPCWNATFEIELSDSGVYELETGIILDNSLKRHVVIGMDIIGSGVSCIDVIKIDSQKYLRLQFKSYAEL